jgi:hypothetical protein
MVLSPKFKFQVISTTFQILSVNGFNLMGMQVSTFVKLGSLGSAYDVILVSLY